MPFFGIDQEYKEYEGNMSNEWNKMNCTKELRNTKKIIAALDAIVTKINQTKEKKKYSR